LLLRHLALFAKQYFKIQIKECLLPKQLEGKYQQQGGPGASSRPISYPGRGLDAALAVGNFLIFILKIIIKKVAYLKPKEAIV
jgi:hypothetical protein